MQVRHATPGVRETLCGKVAIWGACAREGRRKVRGRWGITSGGDGALSATRTRHIGHCANKERGRLEINEGRRIGDPAQEQFSTPRVLGADAAQTLHGIAFMS